jgi:hypothetical protein
MTILANNVLLKDKTPASCSHSCVLARFAHVLGRQWLRKVVLAPGSASKEVMTTARRRRHSCEASVTSSASKAALVVLQCNEKCVCMCVCAESEYCVCEAEMI